MKVVVNRCYGGFGLSEALYEELGIPWDGYGFIPFDDLPPSRSHPDLRTDPRLIAAIEKIGEEAASGDLSSLEIVEIPDGTDFYIDDHDGIEMIHEEHDSW